MNDEVEFNWNEFWQTLEMQAEIIANKYNKLPKAIIIKLLALIICENPSFLSNSFAECMKENGNWDTFWCEIENQFNINGNINSENKIHNLTLEQITNILKKNKLSVGPRLTQIHWWWEQNNLEENIK